GVSVNKYRVNLSSTEREELTALVQSGGVPLSSLTHARVLLMADKAEGRGHTDRHIASTLGVSAHTVGRVRKRMVNEGLSSAVNRKPQPLRPEKLKIRGEVEERLIQLIRTQPPPGYRHWPVKMLACELGVSAETVRGALRRLSGITTLRRRGEE